jgi:hypothetical protein
MELRLERDVEGLSYNLGQILKNHQDLDETFSGHIQSLHRHRTSGQQCEEQIDSNQHQEAIFTKSLQHQPWLS